MAELYKIATAFFESDEWFPEQVGDETTLRMGFQGQSGRWLCVAHILEEQKQIMFYSILDVLVPEDKIYKVAEYVSRANFGLYIGNFELDWDDGEIRFKTAIDVDGIEDLVTPSLVQQLAYTNVTTVDRYLPGLVSVIFSESTPEEAIAMAEEEIQQQRNGYH